MGKLYLTIGDLTLPFEQVIAIDRLIKLHGPGTHWHMNECGCCATIHPNGDQQRGYVVDSEGGFEYHDLTKEDPQ